MKHKKNMRHLVVLSVLILAVFLFREVGMSQPNTSSLQIMGPPDGAIVAPGETITITVEVGTGISSVGIIGSNGLFAGPLKSAYPFEFQLTIPNEHPLGISAIRAIGIDESNERVKSSSVLLQVERAEAPVELKIMPFAISFRNIGVEIPLNVQGIFSDGSLEILNTSSLTSYRSTDPSIVEVNDRGFVKAVGPGEAVITVQHQDLSVEIPVKVPDELPPDDDSDGMSNESDNCLKVSNPNQRNSDGDLRGDVCDNCPDMPNSAQLDTDHDGIGDVCDACQNSDLSATVMINGCDSGVANPLDADGCTISDLVNGALALGEEEALEDLLEDLEGQDILTDTEAQAIEDCRGDRSCLSVAPTTGCTVNEIPNQLCVGTPERDVIFGTDGPDVISGLGGNDIIKGGEGDDIICGDAGRDNLHGNNGDDTLDGGDDYDNLQGNKGFDRCINGENVKKGCEVVL